MAAGSNTSYVALDIGGTSVKAGIVSADGKVAFHRNVRHRGTDALDEAYRVVDDLLSVAGRERLAIGGIGMAVPGRVDSREGTVINASNLGWRNVALKSETERRFRLPTAVMNDANAAAAGELHWGGIGADHFVCITLGTGIGAGVVVDGRVVEGANFLAGEIGHVPYRPDGPPCACGQRGCLETFASGRGMIRRYLAATNPASGLSSAEGRDEADQLHGDELVRLAKSGDNAATRVLTEAAEALGLAVAYMIRLLDVNHVVLAGGVIKMDWPLAERVGEAANRFAPRNPGVTVHRSRLVDVNALLGVTARFLQHGGRACSGVPNDH